MLRPILLTHDGEEKRLDVARDVATSEKCCRALQMAYAGNYAEAIQLLSPVLGGLDFDPFVEGLSPVTTAELYLCAGVIQCAIARIDTTRRAGRRYLRRAAALYRSLGDHERSALCVKELAGSLQRSGFHRHARRVARAALGNPDHLTLEVEASLHLIVANSELSERHYEAALDTLQRAYPLFETVTDDRLRGAFHNTLGIALKNLGVNHHHDDFLQRAIIEFTAAGYHFERAENSLFQSSVENNIGFLLSTLGEHEQARLHIDHAKVLATDAGDLVRASHFDDTLARVLCNEGRLSEAEKIIERAVTELELLGAADELEEARVTLNEIKNKLDGATVEASNVIPFPTPLAALPARFVVSVSDDSLVNAGIEAGDEVWVCRAAKAQDGDLVFADTPDGAMLAYYYAEGSLIMFIFAGGDCEERYYPVGLVRVLGVALSR
jgi:tetratricopeptide (TPR) repeat protein